MKRNLKALLALVCVLALFLTACGPSATTPTGGNQETQKPGGNQETQKPGGDQQEARTDLNIGLGRNITSLDGSGGGYTSTNASMQIYDCLVCLDENLNPTPALATEWQMEDSTTWKFTLRQGIKFHDGSDFNADSVVFSINHYTNVIKYKYSTQWGQAWPPTAEKVDDYTVLLKTAAPQPATPRLVSRLPMLPVDYAGKTQEEFFSAPIGTGAYKFEKWDPGIVLTLTANENYWRGTPAIKTVNYFTVTDDNARVAGFKSGEYQMILEVPYDQMDPLDAMEEYKVLQRDTIGYAAIHYNFRIREGSVIGDIRIRQAIQYAIDAYGICDVIMQGKQTPAAGPAPLSVFGSYDGGGYPHRDLDKARQLMTEAGYNNEEIIFCYSSGEFANDSEISELIVSQLKEAGFNVKFEQVESGAWTDRKSTDQWDLCNNSVPGSFSGEAQYHYNQMKNLTGLELKDFDSIISDADNDVNQSEADRAKDISSAMKVLWDYVPYAFGTVPISSIAMVKNLDGFVYIPLNWIYLYSARYE